MAQFKPRYFTRSDFKPATYLASCLDCFDEWDDAEDPDLFVHIFAGHEVEVFTSTFYRYERATPSEHEHWRAADRAAAEELAEHRRATQPSGVLWRRSSVVNYASCEPCRISDARHGANWTSMHTYVTGHPTELVQERTWFPTARPLPS